LRSEGRKIVTLRPVWAKGQNPFLKKMKKRRRRKRSRERRRRGRRREGGGGGEEGREEGGGVYLYTSQPFTNRK
jgi:hypothetical protein